ncbi:MAG: methyltransferase, TIGR04325 family [Bacteroidales bacterium]|nr:methyltransferase, TIGR04325 family [Bacteroidales bacterium]
MKFFKTLIKTVFSDYLISKCSGIFYGWHGNYKSWNEAKSKCKGYDEKQILDKVLNNALKVKNGEIPFERDSVPFDKKVYSFPLLASLLWIANQNNNKLNVLDFGGALGTSYFQNLSFIKSLSEHNWCIVEQKHFVNEGIKSFEDENLHFYYSIDECLLKYKINVILLSSVIQYIEKPYELLEEIISKQFDYILFDRSLFIENDIDRLTIQTVPKKIYKASYCCWFLSESRFLSLFKEKYDLVYDFDINERINIKSLYKGYLFKRKC